MSTTTYNEIGHAKPGKSTGSSAITNWIVSVFWSFAEAREKEARKRVADHFNGLDDAYLERLGYAPEDIARIRRG